MSKDIAFVRVCGDMTFTPAHLLRGLLFFGYLYLAGSCGGQSVRSSVAIETNTSVAPSTRPLFVHRIDDNEVFQSVAARPESHTQSRTEVVKFLLDRSNLQGRAPRSIYFIDTDRFAIHYFFARDHLSDSDHVVEDHEAFNEREYRMPERRFEMGQLVHYLDGDIYTFELISGDTLSREGIEELARDLQTHTYFGDRLRFRPTSLEQRRRMEGSSVAMISIEEIIGNLAYQPLTLGSAVGRLRIVRSAADVSSVAPDEMVVLATNVEELPVNRGVIAFDYLAPLGHIALLCANRGTPLMALRDEASKAQVLALEGQFVSLQIFAQDYQLGLATEEEIRDARDFSFAADVPPFDAQHEALIPLRAATRADASRMGAKATNIAILQWLLHDVAVRVPDGFVVPFAHYLRHLNRSRGQALVQGYGQLSNLAEKRERLAQIRTAIEAAPCDQPLIGRIASAMRRLEGEAFLFRSSTNAEDLPGFSGAGLYRSVVVRGFAANEICRGVKAVYASVFGEAAEQERHLYSIEPSQVAMAVLVQPLVSDLKATGVAITANPFYEGRPAFFINVQARSEGVTAAREGEIPEQHLLYSYTRELEGEVLSSSSLLAPGSLLLEGQARTNLFVALRRMHEHFLPEWSAHANSVDAEFLLTESGEVVIVQARPFLVRYSVGRQWD